MSAMLDMLYQDMPDKPDDSVDVSHFWGAGLYIRTSRVPKGMTIRQHVHDYDHISIVAQGCGALMTDGAVRMVKAGETIEVKAGQRHAYEAIEDTLWLCVHDEKLAMKEYK